MLSVCLSVVLSSSWSSFETVVFVFVDVDAETESEDVLLELRLGDVTDFPEVELACEADESPDVWTLIVPANVLKNKYVSSAIYKTRFTMLT